ncbi:MAG: acyl-CoA ligase (AMP-forming), exosortase A system-associated [bacterium]
MNTTIHELLAETALHTPDATAVIHKDETLSYQTLATNVEQLAHHLLSLGLNPGDRVAVYLGKQPETVTAFFAISMAGGVFVPINPVLKAAQVSYILDHSGSCMLITNQMRWNSLATSQASAQLDYIVLTDSAARSDGDNKIVEWLSTTTLPHSIWPVVRSTQLAALIYTSGSTGFPKGVMVSQQNLLAGAESVRDYLCLTADDRILCVLPFSFDYGLNQLLSAVNCGATAILIDYLFPRDVIKSCERHSVSGIAGVPSLWHQLVELDWPPECVQSLRYITSSGGTMPVLLTEQLQQLLPDTDIHLMYGLTEAFRATSLPLDQLDSHPDSIGKAIPGAEIHIVDANGEPCAPGVPGELVQSGLHVTQGYWNDAEKTRKRFKPYPPSSGSEMISVWSGDKVVADEKGLLYFKGRMDDMIKVAGFRISPDEIETLVATMPGVKQAVALGVNDRSGLQSIHLVITGAEQASEKSLRESLRQLLPAYMIPAVIHFYDTLPLSPNGKPDRHQLRNIVSERPE